jgi:hypothetical protein
MWAGILIAFLASIFVIVALYVWVIRPRSHRWGATESEVTRSLPGDELVPAPKVSYTQAITIHTAPSQVWPWLVQIGYGRAGWYTYDWIYKLLGAADFHGGDRSSDRIIPELQELKVGDAVKIFEQGPFEVVALQPGRLLVLLARVDTDSGSSFELSDAMPAHYLNNSWAYLLEEIEAGITRLIVRWRGDYSPGFANVLGLGLPTEAGALLMQPKMLKGIKQRAESTDGP